MKFLVILHIYYEYMWPELKSYILNLEENSYDIVVTLSKDNEDLRKDILALNPQAKILLVENKGYDVWPFIKALRNVNLDNYKYLIKLHTKRDMPRDRIILIGTKYFFRGSRWRSLLLSFISLKDNFNKCVECMDKDESIGMVGNKMLLDTIKFKQRFRDPHLKYCIEEAKKMMLKMGIEPIPSDRVYYIGGTMFMCRTSIMKPLLKLDISAEDFKIVERDNENEPAHVLERVFGWLVTSAGFSFADPFTTRNDIIHQLPENIQCRIFTFLVRHRYISKCVRFLFRCDKIDGYREIKVFKIKLFKIKCK